MGKRVDNGGEKEDLLTLHCSLCCLSVFYKQVMGTWMSTSSNHQQWPQGQSRVTEGGDPTKIILGKDSSIPAVNSSVLVSRKYGVGSEGRPSLCPSILFCLYICKQKKITVPKGCIEIPYIQTRLKWVSHSEYKVGILKLFSLWLARVRPSCQTAVIILEHCMKWDFITGWIKHQESRLFLTRQGHHANSICLN